jgi:hypothetical protein
MSHQEQNAAIREQFGQQAPAYARLVRSRADGSSTRLIDALRPTSADHVLDVGCGPGLLCLERVRSLYREDAASGEDRFGVGTRAENGQLWVSYPMTTLVWTRRSVSGNQRAR